MKNLVIAAIAALGLSGAAMAQSVGIGFSGGQGGSVAGATQNGGSLSGGALASLGFASTTTSSSSASQNVTEADNLGGSSTSIVENNGTSSSTNANIGLGIAGAGSNFTGGGLAGGQFGFISLNAASNP